MKYIYIFFSRSGHLFCPQLDHLVVYFHHRLFLVSIGQKKNIKTLEMDLTRLLFYTKTAQSSFTHTQLAEKRDWPDDYYRIGLDWKWSRLCLSELYNPPLFYFIWFFFSLSPPCRVNERKSGRRAGTRLRCCGQPRREKMFFFFFVGISK